MAPKVYNVAVIGYGMSAKVFHIPLIEVVPEFRLHAVVQRSPKADNNAEKDHVGIKVYKTSEDMVKDPEVEVVVVTTTPQSHYELSKLALEHGKHVAVEKPFTETYKEAEELIVLAKKQQRILTVYQNRRWDSDFLTVRKLIEENALGRIVEFETHFDRYSPIIAAGREWKTEVLGGQVIYDLGTHLIDQVVHIFGLPHHVAGFIGAQREGRPSTDEDSCTILMFYDGMLATVKASVISPEVEQLRYWIRGDKGSYKKFNLDPQEDHLKEGRKPGEDGFGIEPKGWNGSLTTIDKDKPASKVYPTVQPLTYSVFYSQLTKALTGHGDVPVKAEEASAIIRLIELARESSQTGTTLKV